MKKKCLKIACAVVLFLMALQNASAQYNLFGDDPGSSTWRQLKTEHYRIIYPSGTDSLARRYLYLFESSRNLNQQELNVDIPSMPVILHPYEVRSNGVTVWSPRRLEIYTTPMSDPLFSCNWEKMLVLHEGRHVGQMSIYTEHLFKWLYYLVGEQSIGPSLALYSDSYMLEGDAVMHETDFTSSGRGRSAGFLRHYRTSFISGNNLSFDQWRLGSFERYTPSYYVFGYLFASNLRDQTGNVNVAGDLYHTYMKRWWTTFWSYNDAHRQVSELTPRELWAQMVTRRTDEWKADDLSRCPFSPRTELLPERRTRYTEYSEIFRMDDGSLVMSKSGKNQARILMKADSAGRQKTVRPFSSQTSSLVFDGKNSLYFAEVVPDPRWTMQSFSVLRKYDLASKKLTDITSRSRLFNPALSEDGQTLFAVEYPVGGGSRLVEVTCSDGQCRTIAAAPGDGQLVNIVQTGGRLYATAIVDEGIGIFRLDGSSWTTLEEPQPHSISYLKAAGKGELSFVSDLDGVENVYFYDVSGRTLDRVTNSRFGVSSPNVDTVSNVLYYSDYDTLGFVPVYVPADSIIRKRTSFREKSEYTLADRLAGQSRENAVFLTPEEDSAIFEKACTLESKPYGKLSNLFHVHSWAPVYVNIDRVMNMSFENIYRTVSPGVTVISQNLLGTAVTTAGYSYHNGFHGGHLTFDYSGWYPVFNLTADFNDRYHTRVFSKQTRGASGAKQDTLSSPSLDISANLYVPLDFSRSGWTVGVIPQIRYSFSNDRYDVAGEWAYKQDILLSCRYYRMLNTAASCIYPRWGYGINAGARRAVTSLEGSESMLYATIYAYFPGFAKNQGLKFSASYQYQTTNDFYGYLNNLVPVPRGYDNRVLTDYSIFSLDYAVPLYAVDGYRFFIGYLRRMQFIPFADVAFDKSVARTESSNFEKRRKPEILGSFGFDALLDFHPFGFSWILSAGFRYSRTFDNRNYMGLLFNVSL